MKSLPGSDVRKVALANLLLRTDGSEAELDRPEIGDVQRSKRESTSSPIPCTETEVDGCLKRISPVCQDLLTDPYLYSPSIEEGITGFGDSVQAALRAFDRQYSRSLTPSQME